MTCTRKELEAGVGKGGRQRRRKRAVGPVALADEDKDRHGQPSELRRNVEAPARSKDRAYRRTVEPCELSARASRNEGSRGSDRALKQAVAEGKTGEAGAEDKSAYAVGPVEGHPQGDERAEREPANVDLPLRRLSAEPRSLALDREVASEPKRGGENRSIRAQGVDLRLPRFRAGAEPVQENQRGTQEVARAGIEPATPRFSAVCSTN